jgi:hypothetical protein
MLSRNDVTPQRYAVPEGHGMPLKRSLLATMLTIASPADTDTEKMQLTGDLAQDQPVTYLMNFAMISRAASRCHWHYYREGKQQTLYFYKARELVDKTTYVSAMYDGMGWFDREEGERGLKDACAWVSSHYDIHPPPGP